MARRKQNTMTRTDACKGITKGLQEFGYPSIKVATVKEVLDAWLDGKREQKLPHGVIGLMAGRQFDEVEEARPGALALLIND